jgi:hypothetical protein
MTPETITALINFGPAGVVVAVVIIFLRFLKERDAQWQAFLHDERGNASLQRKEDRDRIERIEVVIERLATETASFRKDFSIHAAEEMTRYDTIMELSRRNESNAINRDAKHNT